MQMVSENEQNPVRELVLAWIHERRELLARRSGWSLAEVQCEGMLTRKLDPQFDHVDMDLSRPVYPDSRPKGGGGYGDVSPAAVDMR
jgi:hypothetical protein